ncbi:patatin-like phospholipase family protein [Nocardia salmonicida]|uniref:patatin-like phospholipase family protein n=1 Tax=Nocardia salmonicida TaxID=53431 RepID=UPI0037998919
MTTRRGLALGCGGILGFAWTAVALDTIEQALGWDSRSADVIVGTSAGAEMAGALGAGLTPADLLAALDGQPDANPLVTRHLAAAPRQTPALPGLSLPGLGLVGAGARSKSLYTALFGLLPRGRSDASWIRGFGQSLANEDDWVDHPATWLVAADAATGERTVFGAADAPAVGLSDAIAASWAVPGWFPPVTVDGRRFVDGGAVSAVSADLLAPLKLDEVVIVAPATTEGGARATGPSRFERLLRSQMTRGLDREVALLRAAGTRVIRVEPGAAELAAMGPNFMDSARRPAALAAARRAVPARITEAIRMSVANGEYA